MVTGIGLSSWDLSSHPTILCEKICAQLVIICRSLCVTSSFEMCLPLLLSQIWPLLFLSGNEHTHLKIKRLCVRLPHGAGPSLLSFVFTISHYSVATLTAVVGDGIAGKP